MSKLGLPPDYIRHTKKKNDDCNNVIPMDFKQWYPIKYVTQW